MSSPSAGYGHATEVSLEQIAKYAVIALIVAVILHGISVMISGGILVWWGTRPFAPARLIGAGVMSIIAAFAEIGAAFLLLLPVISGEGLPRKEDVLSGAGRYALLYYLVLGYFFLAGLAYTIAGVYLAGISLILASIFFALVFVAWRGMFAMPPMVVAIFMVIAGVLFSIYGFATLDISLGMEAGVLGLGAIFVGIYYLLINMGVRNPGLEKAMYYIVIMTGEIGFIVGGIGGFVSIARGTAWVGAFIAVSVFTLLYGIAALIGGLIAFLYTVKQALAEISAGSPPPAPAAPPAAPPASPPPPPPPGS